MTLIVYSFGAYPTYSMHQHEWRDDDWRVNRLVKALKGDTFRGYANITGVNGKSLRVDAANRPNAFEIFGQWGAKQLSDIGIKKAVLVHVPSSNCTKFDQETTGSRMAEAVADAAGSNIAAASLLAFKKAMEKAHKGATHGRDQRAIKDNLVCKSRRLTGDIVLIDDVKTSGAHLKACAALLRELGANVTTALCAASATQEPVENPLAVEPEDIEDLGFFAL